MASQRQTRLLSRSILGPLILIVLGILLLLTNFGYISASVWRTVFGLWPLIIIFAGLELLITGRASWGVFLLAIIVLLVAGALLHVGTNGPSRFSQPFPGNGGSRSLTTTIQPQGDADRAFSLSNPGAG